MVVGLDSGIICFLFLALPDPEETGFIFEWCNGNRKERENKQTNVLFI